MKKEFGLDASAPILRLHNRTKTAEMKAKAVDNSTLGVPSRVKVNKVLFVLFKDLFLISSVA